MFMEIAQVVAKRSTCFRANVGAIIVINNQIVSMGYNGQAPGEEHCRRICEPGQCPTIHAEMNAIRRLKHFSARRADVTMYCTESPCELCAEEMSEAIGQLYFCRTYRDEDPLNVLQDRGIAVRRILSSGAIMDWKTKQIILC